MAFFLCSVINVFGEQQDQKESESVKCSEAGRGICQNFTDEDHTRVKSIAQLSRHDDIYTYNLNRCVIHFTGDS